MEIKHLAGAAIIALAIPLSAIADAKGKADKITEALNLDAVRAAQVEKIMADYYEGKSAVKAQKKEQLKAVLTEEEMDKLKAMKAEKKEKYKSEKRKDS